MRLSFLLLAMLLSKDRNLQNSISFLKLISKFHQRKKILKMLVAFEAQNFTISLHIWLLSDEDVMNNIL